MATPKPRRYRLTPDRLIVGLLVIEGLLWLSDRLGWPVWHKGYAAVTTVASVGVALLLMLLWFAVALVFRWRFQFSLRSLLVLVVVVAMPCSWLAVEREQARQQKKVVEKIRKLGGHVSYDWEIGLNGIPVHDLLIPVFAMNPPAPAWLRSPLGDDFFTRVVDISLDRIRATDAELAGLRGLTTLGELSLVSAQVTDAGLEHLKGLTQLSLLGLVGTKVTDEGVKRLRRALPKCQIDH